MIDSKAMEELAALYLAANSEISKKLVSPFADEWGKVVAIFGEIARYYATDNLGKVFKKWAASRGDKPIAADDIKKVLPLLQAASMQDDDDLQSRWAALLESTVSSQDTLPSFGQTLSQLNAEEAKFLGRIYATLKEPSPQAPHLGPDRPMSQRALLQAYDPNFRGAPRHADIAAFKDRFTQEQLDNRAKLDRAELVIQDLERLGILKHEAIAPKPDSFITIPHQMGGHFVESQVAGGKIPVHKTAQVSTDSRYSLTPYGLSFIEAVTVKTP